MSEWISVKDQMPERGKVVLGWCKDNPFSAFGCWPVYRAPIGWILCTGHYASVITHWMPLPEPPKEENK